MDACQSCGARLPSDAKWCPQCYAPVETQAPSDPDPVPPIIQQKTTLTHGRYSRWHKGDTSFGPVGRIVATVVLVVLPTVFFLIIPIGPFGLVGAALWIFVISPMLLRSIWKKTRVVD